MITLPGMGHDIVLKLQCMFHQHLFKTVLGHVLTDEYNVVISADKKAVSYTHLDVYKRQHRSTNIIENLYCNGTEWGDKEF